MIHVSNRDSIWDSMKWLGIDVGSKTLGLAISDDEAKVALPLCVLSRRNDAYDLSALETVIREQGCEAIVIGLPLELSGKEGPAAQRSRKIGTMLQQRFGLMVHYYDERFSTVVAERALIEGDMRRNARKSTIDKVAAALILQGFLDETQRREPS